MPLMTKRIFIPGAAGLVGQNLIAAIASSGVEIVAADKHPANLKILRSLHPEITLIEADLAEPGSWQAQAATCDCVVMLQAQIGGLHRDEFERNNVTATRRVLDAVQARKPYLVHVSSSVVNSAAEDFYTETKAAQEAVVEACGLRQVILRPTLMFGWFDRKHVGWLKRFMDRTPVFPIPGDGRYLRQPLFAGDFAAIIAACIEREPMGAYNISGLEKIDYGDLIRLIKAVTGSRTPIAHIPYGLFWLLLSAYALLDRNPPFTTRQLEALVTPDVFEVIDWPAIFGAPATSLRRALEITFLDPVYSDVALKF
jgi:nucleoside-diphosphate-sugar epimerase